MLAHWDLDKRDRLKNYGICYVGATTLEISRSMIDRTYESILDLHAVYYLTAYPSMRTTALPT